MYIFTISRSISDIVVQAMSNFSNFVVIMDIAKYTDNSYTFDQDGIHFSGLLYYQSAVNSLLGSFPDHHCIYSEIYDNFRTVK